MSTLTVKELAAPTGYDLKIASGETLDLKSQGTVTMPTGSVLQVVSTSTMGNIAIASSSFVDTGLGASITPSSTSNKILIMLSGGALTCNNQGRRLVSVIYRDSTILTNSQTMHNSPYDPFFDVHSITYLDSPSSTSSISYDVYAKQINGSVYFNTGDGGVSLTLMEIAG